MRNTSGFAQIAQKNCENSFRFMRKNSQKNISGFVQIAQKKMRKTAQNSLRFMRKSSQKKNCAKISQILRKKYSHFVETLVGVEWLIVKFGRNGYNQE